MAKKLVVCFDGTWNKPDDTTDGKNSNTNVERLFVSIDGIPADAVGTAPVPDGATIKWYDTGVGTAWYEHIRGGAFGYGLSRNIRQGYKFLVDRYTSGDEIYIFGFSRGAYTARSLVGLIRNSGLLDRDVLLKGSDPKYTSWKKLTAEKFYRMDPDDVPHIMDAYQLYRNRDGSADSDFAVKFRTAYAHRDVKITFLGVWDTVGALGIPFKLFDSFNAEEYKFHDEELSGIVENAYHAVAIDEHRENYDVTLWKPKQKVNQAMEQVWFAGAHADVGGGYEVEDHPLSDAALAWMQEKARLNGAGLSIAQIQQVNDVQLAAATPTDSYREFLGGLYRMIKDRHYRAMGSAKFGNEYRSPITGRIPGYWPNNPGFPETPVRTDT